MADKRHIIKEIVTDGIRLRVRELPYNLKELGDVADSSKVISIEALCTHSAYYYVVEFQDGTARHFRHDQVDSVVSDVWYEGKIVETVAKAWRKAKTRKSKINGILGKKVIAYEEGETSFRLAFKDGTQLELYSGDTKLNIQYIDDEKDLILKQIYEGNTHDYIKLEKDKTDYSKPDWWH